MAVDNVRVIGVSGLGISTGTSQIDMEMKRKMLDRAPAPVVNDVTPWRQPGILDWLNRLTNTPELCAANRQQTPENSATNA